MSKVLHGIPIIGFILVILLGGGLAMAQDVAVVPADSASFATVVADTLNDRVDHEAKIQENVAVDMWDSGVNATGAVLMTPLFPGWGQLYADNSWRGALAFSIELFYWSNMLALDLRATRYRGFAGTFETENQNYAYYNLLAEDTWESMRDFAWWSGGVMLIIALDAYVGAHLFHFDDDPVPVPNEWDEHFEPLGYDRPLESDSPSFVVFQWRKTF